LAAAAGAGAAAGFGVDWPAVNVGRHPANKIVVEGRAGHPAQAMEDGGVFLIHETGDAGVAGLGVRDCAKHCRQVRNELLGVEVRLRDFRKSSRCSDRLVLLREVGLDSGGVVARDLEGPKVLELVEPLQAVEGELVEHWIVLVNGEEGQTVVVFCLDAVSGSRVLEVEQAACPRHMSERAQVTTSCENHRGLGEERREFLLLRSGAVVERGGDCAGTFWLLEKDPLPVAGRKRSLQQRNHYLVVTFDG
jgi:hypothetical protein